MAIFDGVEELQKYVLNEVVLAQITAAVQILREEVTVGSIVHDEVNVVLLLDHTMEGDDVRVC